MSVSTVSRALNGDYGVKPKTRELVLDTAKELGYVPNLAAKELVNKKSKLIGIIITDSDYEARPAFFELLPYMNKTLALHHYRTIICAVSENSYTKGELNEILASRSLNGCIVMSAFPSHHPIYEDIKGIDTPTVVLEQTILTRTSSNLNTDEILGAYMATQFLIEHGHRRIALVNGTEAFEVSRQRLEGFLRAADEAGIPPSDRPVLWSDYTGRGGQEAVHRLLRLHPETTAVFFANDLMAMGAISSLAEAGIQVPSQLSVIGYDGLYVGKYYNPPLASIVIDNPVIGMKAAELLLELIHGGSGRTVRVKPHLFPGKSVAARSN